MQILQGEAIIAAVTFFYGSSFFHVFAAVKETEFSVTDSLAAAMTVVVVAAAAVQATSYGLSS